MWHGGEEGCYRAQQQRYDVIPLPWVLKSIEEEMGEEYCVAYWAASLSRFTVAF